MDKDMERLGKERLKRVKRRRQLATFVISMAVIVLSITVYRLIQPASAEDQNKYEFEIDQQKDTYINLASLKSHPQIEVNGNNLPVKWDGSEFKMNAHLSFAIDVDEYTTTDGKNLNYYYSYGKDVHVPDSLMKEWYTDEKNAFQYHFVKDEAGNYAVVIKFKEDYLKDNPKLSDAYIDFDCTVSGRTDESGDVVVAVGGDATLTIKPDMIEWNKDTSLNYDIKVNKTNSTNGTLATDENGRKYAEYVIEVSTTKGTPDVIELNDLFDGNGMKVDLDSVTYSVVKGNADVTNQCDCKFTQNPDNEKQWNLSATLPKLEAGESYKLTYRYYIDTTDFKNGQYVAANNKVEVSSEDKKNNEKVIDTSTSSVSYTKDIIEKKGELQDDKTTIKWTITINKSRDDISGYTLTDNMLDQAENFTITSEQSNADKGYDIIKDADGKIQKIVFKEIDGQKNDCSYVITYETKADRQMGAHTVTNKAEINKDVPGENGTSSDVTVPGTLNGKDVISKKYVSNVKDEENSTYTLTWNSEINIPTGTIKAGATYEDALKNTWNSPEWHYMTYDQAEALINQFKDVFGDYIGNFKVRVNYQFVDWNTVKKSDNPKIQSLTFEFIKDYTNSGTETEKHSFTYNTTGKIPEQGGLEYGNVIHFGDCWAKDSFKSDKEPVKSRITKMDGNNQTGTTQVTGNKDGTVTWKVRVVLDKNANQYVITDNLPDGVQIEQMKVVMEDTYKNGFVIQNLDGTEYTTTKENSDDKTSGIIVKAQKNNDNSIVTTVRKASDSSCYGWYEGSSIYVIYTCKIDGYDEAKAGDTFTFKNSASAKSDTNDNIGNSDQTQIITKPSSQDGGDDNPDHGSDVLKKDCVWKKGNRTLNYTVVINPDGKDLVENCDQLDLVDVLKYDERVFCDSGNNWIVGLNPQTVKLYEAKKNADGELVAGDEIKDWSYTYEETVEDQYNPYNKTKTIKAKVPDGKAMILKYVYNVNALRDLPDSVGYDPEFDVKNTVSLTGISHDTTQDNTKVSYNNAHTSAGISKANSYVLYKVETQKFNEGLAGAEFELYKYDPTSTDPNKTSDGYVPVKQYTTDKNGQIVIEFDKSIFDFNRQYFIVETKAPKGYILPDNPKRWMFYYESNDTKKYPIIAPNDSLDGRKPSDGFLQDFIEDDKIPTTSIDITKNWKDSQGNVIDKKDGKIYLEVHQVSSDGTDKTYGNAVEVTPDSNGNWNYTIGDLPLYAVDDNGHQTGISYSYYIKETGVDEQHVMNGYIASYVYTDQNGQTHEYSNNVVPSSDSAITSGKVEITNTLNVYELPETGGSGNRWLYMLSGVVLMAIAAITLFYKKQKLI